MSGQNIGDLLNTAGVTWGWFYGDFPQPTGGQPGGTATCDSLLTTAITTRSSSIKSDRQSASPAADRNVQNRTDRSGKPPIRADRLMERGSGRKPSRCDLYQSERSQYRTPFSTSTPLNEQGFLVETINALQQTPQWPSMAILITWDDSDGWYDHVMPPIVNPSSDAGQRYAQRRQPGACGTSATGELIRTVAGTVRRLPFLGHLTVRETESRGQRGERSRHRLRRFIEDNWGLPRIGDQSVSMRWRIRF